MSDDIKKKTLEDEYALQVEQKHLAEKQYKISRLLTIGRTSDENIEIRKNICRTCQIVDNEGNRLYRKLGIQEYCGRPSYNNLNASTGNREGLGFLNYKITLSHIDCPFNCWKIEMNKMKNTQ